MFEQTSQLLSVGVGGLIDSGSGFTSSESWIVAFVMLLVLVLLARWTMRPARRASRTQRTAGPHETISAQPATEHAGDDAPQARCYARIRK